MADNHIKERIEKLEQRLKDLERQTDIEFRQLRQANQLIVSILKRRKKEK